MKAWDNFKKLERIDQIQRVLILILMFELLAFYLPSQLFPFSSYIYIILGAMFLIVWIEITKYKAKNEQK